MSYVLTLLPSGPTPLAEYELKKLLHLFMEEGYMPWCTCGGRFSPTV